MEICIKKETSSVEEGFQLAYKDLAIRLSSEGKHQFVASALEEGESVASNSFELRSDELRIIERLRELEKAAIKPESMVTFHKDFGQELYGKVLAGDLKSYFQKQLEANGEGLRISLQFDDNAQWLATLPWEFLHDGEDFLVARRNTLISRMPSSIKKVQSAPLESVLRMLVIISSPQDPSCAPLDTERERDRILQAVDKLYVQQKMEVDFTDDATFETIQSYLNEKDYHIVHFTGHGIEVDGQGFLILENEDFTSNKVGNQAVADLFAERGIRLVVLSACESSDLADKLVRKGLPAVVAMQYSILDPSAAGFAFAFYQALASGRAIDQSLTEARLAMRNAKGSNKIDFATPVLYLLDPDCLHTGKLRAIAADLSQKPVFLGDFQVIKDGFVGRNRELRVLQKAFLSDAKRAAIVYGWGGIGKTVLATRLATRMIHHFEGFFGHKCNPQTRPEEILNSLNAFLNMAGLSDLNRILYSADPLPVKTAALARILNHKRFLILLDNFESCLDESHSMIADPELRQFVEHLLNNTTSNTKYIITTRYDFDPLNRRLTGAIEHLLVPEMPLYQAVSLMNNRNHLTGLDFEKKKTIYRVIGGHPWTIDMFSNHASRTTVDSLLLDLGRLERELKEFTLFDKSYSELDGVAKELLIRASVFEEAVSVEALSWIMGDDKEPSPTVDQPLQMLLEWGLLSKSDEVDGTLYSVHTMVRMFVNQEEGHRADSDLLFLRAAQYHQNKSKVSQSLWDLLRAREYYVRAAKWCNQAGKKDNARIMWNQAACIAIDARQFLASWGYNELAMRILGQAVQTTSGTIRARAIGQMALTYQDLGDWETALKMCSKANEIFEKVDDKRCIAASLHQVGTIHEDHGNYEDATKLYQDSLEILEKLDDKQGIIACLYQLGSIHTNQGDYATAVDLFQRGLDLAEDLGDKRCIASILLRIGIIHRLKGEYVTAVDLFQQSLDLAEKLGDKQITGPALYNIGIIHRLKGEYAKAVDLFQRSLDVDEELGNKQGIAFTLREMGIIHRDQGNYAEAMKKYQKSLEINEALGDKSGIASSLGQMGRIKEECKDFEGALRDYITAQSIFRELQHPSEEIAKKDIARLRMIMGEEAFKSYLIEYRRLIMSLETVKCPYCGYVYRSDIEKIVKDGHAVAVRKPDGKFNIKPGEEMYIDLKCPNCNKEFEWLVK